MVTQEVLDGAVKALTITGETVLFVDIDQVKTSMLENRDGLPRGLLIVGVRGMPNVSAMTRSELLTILLDLKEKEISARSADR